MKPNIDLFENHLNEPASLLSTVLADEYALYTKTRNPHWNIQRPNFIALQNFYETQYDALVIIIDDVAERACQLGHFALGSMIDFTPMARLSEHNYDFSDTSHIIQTLLEDH